MRIVVHTSLNCCERLYNYTKYKTVLICHNCLIIICDDDDKEEKEEEERKDLNLIGLWESYINVTK